MVNMTCHYVLPEVDSISKLVLVIQLLTWTPQLNCFSQLAPQLSWVSQLKYSKV